MVFETSWDDFTIEDVKLIELLDKYNIPAMFYVPIQNELGMDIVQEISKNYRYQIGSHTISHPMDLKIVEEPFLENEVLNSKNMLELVVDKPVTSFCYPRGRYNDWVIEAVQRAGYTEARTTKVLHTSREYDPFMKPTTVHCYQRKEYSGEDWFDVAKRLFKKAQKENGYFHLWGHSREIEKYNDWDKLEKFFKFCHNKI